MIKCCGGAAPALAPTARVAETAVLAGRVTLGEEASVWYGAVLRGDESAITVGEGSNVQDNAVLHCDPDYPLAVGREVTVGHAAVVHGCTVGDRCVIGMGAILLNGCVIGAECMVGAGALVTQHREIPPGSLVMGAPARVVRPLTPEERAGLARSAADYRRAAAQQLPLGLDGEKTTCREV